jgi:hypothetical protein
MMKLRKMAAVLFVVAAFLTVGALVAHATGPGKPVVSGAAESAAGVRMATDPMARLAQLQLFALPPGGVDHLYFEVTDRIEVPGLGEDVVTMSGTYKIRRSDPTTNNWSTATIDVQMVDLDVRGTGRLIGEVHAGLNPDRLTLGRVGPAGGDMLAKKPKPTPCRFAAFMQFTLPGRNMVLVNKDPIPLLHTITHIPPIGQGGGTPGEVAIGFYDRNNLDGPAVAILKAVKTEIGPWVE